MLVHLAAKSLALTRVPVPAGPVVGVRSPVSALSTPAWFALGVARTIPVLGRLVSGTVLATLGS